jgi:hypothetical protein
MDFFQQRLTLHLFCVIIFRSLLDAPACSGQARVSAVARESKAGPAENGVA